MFTPRHSPRIPVILPARLDYSSTEGPLRQLAARTIDLSHRGIAIASTVALPIGTPLRVAVEEPGGGRRRVQRWLGRVVNVREGLEGHRVGIEFLKPDVGPIVSIQLTRPDGRHRQLRLDPAWDLESPAIEEPAESASTMTDAGTSLSRLSFRVFQGVTLFGYLADQVTKAHAFRLVRTASRVHEVLPGLMTAGAVKNFGAVGGLTLNLPLASEAFALLSLGLTGFVARRAIRAQDRWRPIDSVGWGCLLAGMLGNTIDRLALGYVRDFLVARPCPNWSFNLADVLAIGGTLMLVGSWAYGHVRREPAVDRPPVTSTP